MKKIRKFNKCISLLLLIIVIQSTITPTLAWALTSGPTTPEVASFEPVDVTDMVQLQTGDFTYTVPLFEIPGPEGGYPVSLSYHAGIKPNQDASWVGLGWNLNPGEINRTTNGVADDFRPAILTNTGGDVFHTPNTNVWDYWDGGSTTTHSFGLGFGYASAHSSIGFEISNDTYKGVGVVGTVSFGIGFGGAGVNLIASTNGTAGLGISAGMGNASIGATFMTNFKDRVYGSVNAGMGPLGISLGSGGNPSFSVGGFSSSAQNDKQGKITSKTKGFNIGIYCPIGATGAYIDLSYGYRHTRYWSDESDQTYTFGALYGQSFIEDANTRVYNPFTTSYDCYSLLDPEKYDQIENNNPDKLIGGTFPDYDSYTISGQGVSGVVEPYIFENPSLMRREGSSHWPNSSTWPAKREFSKEVNFRFKGDFSNRYLTNGVDVNESSGSLVFSTPTTNTTTNYNNSRQLLGGSKHIEWFSNSDVYNGIFYKNNPTNSSYPIGFMKYDGGGASLPEIVSNYGQISSSQIYGFMVTNESGVTYHYSLPVYAYNETTYIEEKYPARNKKKFRVITNKAPYAYTWLLTAITGPDFVDRGGGSSGTEANHVVDDNDYGYYVKFNYGCWTDLYKWRTPGEGSNIDIDGMNTVIAYGNKQLYYLNSIETRTHTALFYKDVRYDGKSVAYEEELIDYNYADEDYRYSTHLKNALMHNTGNVSLFNQGGYKPKVGKDLDEESDLCFFPCATLKLSKILLIKKDQAGTRNMNLNKPLSGNLNLGVNLITNPTSGTKKFPNDVPYPASFPPRSYYNTIHKGENTLELADETSQADLISKSIKSIDFVYEEKNGLCPQTKNSFTNDLYNASRSYSDNISYVNSFNPEYYSKLTLKSVVFKGYAGAKIMPNLDFDYELSNPISGHCNVINYDPTINKAELETDDYEGLNIGDLVKIKHGTSSSGQDLYFYAALLSQLGVGHYSVKFLSQDESYNPASTSYSNLEFKTTKNPPYNSEFYDNWGYYKAIGEIASGNDYVSRDQNTITAKNTDVWSLRKITNPLGAEINIAYESDVYKKPVLHSKRILPVKETGWTLTSPDKVTFSSYSEQNLSDLLYVGNSIDISLLLLHTGDVFSASQLTTCPHPKSWCNGVNRVKYWYKYDPQNYTCTVNQVNSTTVTLQSIDLYNKLSTSIARETIVLAPDCNVPGIECDFYFDYNNPPGIISGFISTTYSKESYYGGGIRVKELVTADPQANTQLANYYKYELTDGVSSGVTSYEPGGLDVLHYDITNQSSLSSEGISFFDEEYRKLNDVYRSNLIKCVSSSINYARFIPPPDVYYSSVKVSVKGNADKEYVGYQRYEFKTFEEDMFQKLISKNETNSSKHWGVRKYRDFSSGIGSLKSLKIYNNNNELVNSQLYNYYDYRDKRNLNDIAIGDCKYNGQGVVQQAFNELRVMNFNNGGHTNVFDGTGDFYAVASLKEEYPSILESVTSFKDGITTTTYNNAYDMNSGACLEIVSKNSMGESYKATKIPAYWKYPLMGPTTNNPANKFMISQNTAEYSYVLKGTTWEPLSASVQTWSNAWRYLDFVTGQALSIPSNQQNAFDLDVWRKHQSWAWAGTLNTDGTFKNFDDFTWENPSAQYLDVSAWSAYENTNKTNGWLKTSQITLYDKYSKALEAFDVNGNYTATKMGYGFSLPVGTIANCNYESFATSGFEDRFASAVTGGGRYYGGHIGPFAASANEQVAGTTLNPAHTGSYMIAVGSSYSPTVYEAFVSEGLMKNKTYIASVWVKGTGKLHADIAVQSGHSAISTASSNQVANINSGGWHLETVKFFVPDYAVKLTLSLHTQGMATAYYDDFRTQPIDANLTAYVYDTKTMQISYIIDNDNFYTKFVYDNAGRLTGTYKETATGVKKISKIEYSYAREL